MVRVHVYREADNGLSRRHWCFSPSVDRIGFSLTLDAYAVERRKTKMGRFARAVTCDRWGAMDERHYTSGLSRPTEIPADVLDEAWRAVPRTAYIGWCTDEHRLAA